MSLRPLHRGLLTHTWIGHIEACPKRVALTMMYWLDGNINAGFHLALLHEELCLDLEYLSAMKSV